MIVLLAAALVMQPPNARTAANEFVSILQSDAPAVLPSLRARGAPFAELVERLDGVDCVHVDHILITGREVKEGVERLRVEIDASGTGVNVDRHAVRLPPVWYLTFDEASQRLVRVDSAATYDARRLGAASNDDARHAVIETAEVPFEALVEAVFFPNRGADGKPFQSERDAARAFIEYAMQRRDPRLEAVAWSAAARAENYPGRMLGAKYAAAALEFAKATDDCAIRTSVGLIVGNTFSMAHGDFSVLRDTAAEASATDDARDALRALHNYANNQLTAGDIREALIAAEELVERSRASGWREGEGMAAWTLASIRSTFRDFDAARRYFRTAYDVMIARGRRPWAALALADAADVERRAGNPAGRLALMKRAMAMDPPAIVDERVRVEGAYARALAESGDVAEADRVVAEVVALKPRTMPIDVAGALLAMNRPAEALVRLEGWRRTSNKWEDEPYWGALLIRAAALRKLGRTAEAIDVLRSAIEITEDHRTALPAAELSSTRYFEDHIRVYHDLIETLVEAGASAEALAIAERAKARLLRDFLTFGRATVKPIDPREREALDDLNRAAVTAQQSFRARQAFEQLMISLEIKYGVSLPVRPPVLPPLESIVSADESVIEFASLERSLIAFVISGPTGKVTAIEIPIDRATIARRVADLQTKIGAADLSYSRLARSIAVSILRPIQQRVELKRVVHIVPDGPLWQLPFHALPDRDGQPFSLRHAVSYAPTIAMLEKRERDPSLPSLLASDALDESEVAGVRLMYRKASIASNETAFKQHAREFSVLHLAAHATVDSRFPMFSGISLGRSAGDDGVLEAREVAAIPLHASLAVLSGCDTGGGAVADGEGLIGFSWAFFVAGCPATVVSQWRVDTTSTTELMTAFHRHLLEGRRKSEALRMAQMDLRSQPRYAHPFYWAPFIVLGDDSPITR